jgi:sugar lactone lactonase YvrE
VQIDALHQTSLVRFHHFLLAGGLTVTALSTSSAQMLAAVMTAADSASAARAAWGSAIRASRARDTITMRREIERAATLWPTQQAYVWNLAVIAAAQGDTGALKAALAHYAGLGLGRDLATEKAFAPFRAAPWFDSLRSKHDANRAAIARSTVRAVLPDSTTWPEGVDFDPRTGRYYVGSIRQRTIVEVAPSAAARELWPRGQEGIGAVMGVRVDTSRNVIWATLTGVPQMSGFVAADTGIAALVQVRISDGAILRRWDLQPGRHVLGDLAVAPDGAVYMSDSQDPVLYRLRSATDTLEALRHPLFRSLQGIAIPTHGDAIYVADYSHGLLRVDFSTGSVTRVADAPNSTTLGCDGIVWYEGSILAVQNGVAPARIMRLRLDPIGERIVSAEVLDRNAGIADEPTIGTLVGDEFVYVANSQWEKYSDDGTLKAGAPLARPKLLAITLRP